MTLGEVRQETYMVHDGVLVRGGSQKGQNSKHNPTQFFQISH